MAQLTFWERLKEFIGGIAFDVFLWSIGRTAAEYAELIIQAGSWFPPHCKHGYNGLCPTCDAMNTPPVEWRKELS